MFTGLAKGGGRGGGKSSGRSKSSSRSSSSSRRSGHWSSRLSLKSRSGLWQKGSKSVSRSGYPRQPGSYKGGGGYTGESSYYKSALTGGYGRMTSNVLKGGTFSGNAYKSTFQSGSIQNNFARAAHMGLTYRAFRMYRPGYLRYNFFYVPYRYPHSHIHYVPSVNMVKCYCFVYQSDNSTIPSIAAFLS